MCRRMYCRCGVSQGCTVGVVRLEGCIVGVMFREVDSGMNGCLLD